MEGNQSWCKELNDEGKDADELKPRLYVWLNEVLQHMVAMRKDIDTVMISKTILPVGFTVFPLTAGPLRNTLSCQSTPSVMQQHASLRACTYLNRKKWIHEAFKG